MWSANVTIPAFPMPTDLVARVAYDGPDVEDGSMDVRDLAPALLAIGDLLQASNDELNGATASMSVQVRSDFKSGSFDIGLGLLVAGGTTALLAPFAEKLVTAKQIAECIGLIKSTGMTLLGLIKALGGKKPDAVTPAGGSDVMVSVTGINHRVNVNVYKLYMNQAARKGASDAVRPLRDRAGITAFEVRDEAGKAIETIHRSDLDAFTFPSGESRLLSEGPLTTIYVEVLRAAFRPNLRWKVSDGASRFGVLITDKEFWRKVDAHELTFGRGERLKVTMKFTQRLIDGQIVSDYEIVEVLDIVPPMKQLRFDDLNDEDPR